MYIDTHAHISKDDYEDIDSVIAELGNNIVVISGVDAITNNEVLQLCNKYDNVYGTLGIHPSNVDDCTNADLIFIEEHINDDKIVAVGEVGLDYHWGDDNKDRQKDIFIKQIEIAKRNNKAVVIHSRDTDDDMYEIIKKHKTDDLRVTLHCFSGDLNYANKMVDLGVMLGIGGVVTFKKEMQLKEVVANVSLDYLLLETDSPFLSPEPHRGQQNKSSNIDYIALKIAEIKGKTVTEVLQKTTANAVRQFDLKI